MDHFNYQDRTLFAENVSVQEIVEEFGTPCYIYSRATLTRHWNVFNDILGDHPHRICYALKANGNLGVLNVLARLGSGFDIVSEGELARVLAAGGKGENCVFSGVGKTESSIQFALENKIYCLNVESMPELERIQKIAKKMGTRAPIAFRVNPDVNARTHPYISTGLKDNKFGIPLSQAISCYQHANALPHIEIRGVACHIGSQITEMPPFLQALDSLLDLTKNLEKQGILLHHVDIGGGLGVRYAKESPPALNEYAHAILERFDRTSLEIIMEPGRAIAANMGILVTKIEYLKKSDSKRFAIVDAGMNDLMRPSLYNAWHEILPVVTRPGKQYVNYDIVGPVCESGDFLGKHRRLNIKPGDLLAVRGTGAYAFTMSSNYNTRPRAAEVMVDGDKMFLVRARETIQQLFQDEQCLPNCDAESDD